MNTLSRYYKPAIQPEFMCLFSDYAGIPVRNILSIECSSSHSVYRAVVLLDYNGAVLGTAKGHNLAVIDTVKKAGLKLAHFERRADIILPPCADSVGAVKAEFKKHGFSI